MIDEEMSSNLNLKKLRLEIWEKENPDEVKKVEEEIKDKMMQIQEEIKGLVETKVETYFKVREEKMKEYKPSYIG